MLYCGNVCGRIVNAMGAGLVGVNAVSMGLLSASAYVWDGEPNASGANTIEVIVTLLQLTALCGECCPPIPPLRSRYHTVPVNILRA